MGGGSSEQLLLSDEGNKEPDRWSADGRYILFDYTRQEDQGHRYLGPADVWRPQALSRRRKARPVDYYGMLSPDGKWVAYESDESGRGEIYVVPFPGPGGKWQVSTTGGIQPFWPPGKELFYVNVDSRLSAVEYSTDGPNFIVGKSRLILGGHSLASTNGMDVNRNDKRWLMAMPVGEPNSSPLILTTNWTAALKQ